ncbi:hypothetical protein ACTU3I_15935 [Microbacterium sp. RD1]|uniref:hypothetical protein n=1 Tax=Microbacterium sp. RD1 TaxID=3457313 RepID=UPI003FA5E5BD
MSTTPPEPQHQPTPPPAYSPPPGEDRPARREKGPAGLGVVAFVVALVGGIAGGVLAYIAGVQIGSLAQFAETTTEGNSVSITADSLPPEGQQILILGGALTLAAFAVWGVLALWAFIQGIVAIVKNRGRVWGIFALVLAVLGVIAVSVLYGAGIVVGIAPYAS